MVSISDEPTEMMKYIKFKFILKWDKVDGPGMYSGYEIYNIVNVDGF